MQQSDYEIVGKFGFESRTHRQIRKKALIHNRIGAFLFLSICVIWQFVRWLKLGVVQWGVD